MKPATTQDFEYARSCILSQKLHLGIADSGSTFPPQHGHTSSNYTGIGTLSEKTTHAILKLTYCPNPAFHEISVEGSIAEICTGTEIIEIQSAAFHQLRKKLDKFLPLMPVTIVYPIPHTKWLRWIDPQTGEVLQSRKSPKCGSPLEISRQLVHLLDYLSQPNLHFCIAMLDLEEYRLLDGWSRDKKKGSHRYDRIPSKLADQILIDRVEDYMQVIPYPLTEPFTVKDFEKAARISHKTAADAITVLRRLELIRHVGNKGQAFLYEVRDI